MRILDICVTLTKESLVHRLPSIFIFHSVKLSGIWDQGNDHGDKQTSDVVSYS